LETAAGQVHAGRSIDVGESLLVLADRAGRHEIRWTAYTKSARKATHGTITLVVPRNSDRPAFGRMHGIVSFPDVPIVVDDGEVVHAVRVADPPLSPPTGDGTGDVFDELRRAHAYWEWDAFGLDPVSDGPGRSVVVRSAERVAHDVHD